jgi:hypothetical protein
LGRARKARFLPTLTAPNASNPEAPTHQVPARQVPVSPPATPAARGRRRRRGRSGAGPSGEWEWSGIGNRESSPPCDSAPVSPFPPFRFPFPLSRFPSLELPIPASRFPLPDQAAPRRSPTAGYAHRRSSKPIAYSTSMPRRMPPFSIVMTKRPGIGKRKRCPATETRYDRPDAILSRRPRFAPSGSPSPRGRPLQREQRFELGSRSPPCAIPAGGSRDELLEGCRPRAETAALREERRS